jgi:hypothetical protein
MDSHTRLMTVFQPAKAVICPDRKNIAVKEIPLKKTAW